LRTTIRRVSDDEKRAVRERQAARARSLTHRFPRDGAAATRCTSCVSVLMRLPEPPIPP
jgi:hypothetical protein